MYCNTLLEGEVYCNRNCIVGLVGKEIISQYSILYCDMGAKGNGQGFIAIHPLHLRHGLALCLRHSTGAGCKRAGCASSRRALGGLGAVGSWGAQGSRRWAHGARRRACVGTQASVRGRALGAAWHGRAGGRRGRAGGRTSARQGERAASARQGRARQGRGSRRGAHSLGAGRTVWALGAQPVRTGLASWVLLHPAWFSTWFFDSVFS